ncbi:ATP-binding protein [Pseudomonas sp. JH-2]|uniref:ATP-binding protein n=1 Tax=Pseudomonas sp. JH-2 TaxID=3114998 RepID=UPI002E2702C3|nr:ATP-binding protein [Pseudomonas sp. JH-2]
MKLRQFLRPIDTSFSTPSAARKLLRLLCGALSLCLLCSLAFALSMAFNHEVSISRRHMNAAMYEAQLYLFQRESLLEHLNRSVVQVSADPAPRSDELNEPVPPYARVTLPLGNDGRRWGLAVSGRDLAELEVLRLNLLYVEPAPQPVVSRLNGPASPDLVIPPVVLEVLRNAGPGADGQLLWLADPADPKSRLYLMSRIHLGGQSGWLGLELYGSDLAAALAVPEAGHYLLLDGHHQMILGSDSQPISAEQFRTIWTRDSFDFTGGGLLPQHVALLMHIGASHWSLIYYQEVGELLLRLWPLLLITGVFCLGLMLAVALLSRRIDQRLIQPAQQRLSALKESEAFSRAVIQTSPVALCVLRRIDGEVVLENQQARQWLGDGGVLHQSGGRWIEQAFGGGGGPACEELTAGDGRHLYLTYVPTRYNGEEVLFCAFSDISERKRAEAEMAHAKQLADAANEAKTLFLATMSHEIRTPLYGVLGTLELLGRTALDMQQTGYLQAIQRSSSTLLQLISDVLDVSKIEAGQLVLEPVEFSPVELTEEAVQSFAAAAQAKGLLIYACLDPQLPSRLRGDAACIRQILNNLLSNAVKFTDNGRIVVRVKASVLDAERLSLVWQVTDTGGGIAAEEQTRLFDPFYQVGRNVHQAGGTGLGLSICQRLTQLMNGSLQVVSEVGLGSSFALALPLERAAGAAEQQELSGCSVQVLSPVRELSESLCGWIQRWGGRVRIAYPGQREEADERTVLVELQLPGSPLAEILDWPGCRVIVGVDGYTAPRRQDCDWLVGLNSLEALRRAIGLAQGCVSSAAKCQDPVEENHDLGLRVLVAEDNVINQLILKDQLEALGCLVELVSDGQEALQRWRPERFDAVLTDVNMPRMNGYQLTAELRRRGCRHPIIGATANAMREERERCLAAGMSDCLVKPVDLDSLYRCLAPIGEVA